jgi:hypothetical protein
MPSGRLGKGESPLFFPSPRLSPIFQSVVFVTGNAGKLREVREILAQSTPIEVESRDLDREWSGRNYHASHGPFHNGAPSAASIDPLFFFFLFALA